MTGVRGNLATDQSMMLQGASFVDTKAGYTSLEPELDQILGGRNLPAARKALDAIGVEQRAKVFATPIGEKRMVPVLNAARNGAPHMIALFAGMNASLDVQSAYGLMATHVAFDYGHLGTARTLLTDPVLRPRLIDTNRVSHELIRQKLALIPYELKPTDPNDLAAVAVFDRVLDQATLSLTDGDLKQLTVTDRLGLYVSHVHEQTDSPTNFRPEAWNPELAFEHRIRTLVGMIAMTEPAGEQRDLLVREIAVTTEALQTERRVYRMTNISDPELTKLGLEHEALGIIGKLQKALWSGNPELTHQLIAVATPQHLMCLELQPIYIDGEKSVLIHFDNLGAGNDAHETKGQQVYPLSFIMPFRKSAVSDVDNVDLLKNLLVELLSQRCQGSIVGVYQALYRFMAALTGENLTAVKDPSPEDAPAYSQVAGSCTIANIGPSTRRRLGDYADAFLAFESEDSVRRLIASSTPERIRDGIALTVAKNKAKRGL